jgi:hypothetical protein
MCASPKNRRSIPEALADEATRQELSRARKRTRTAIGRKLNVSRETIRRIEKRTDLYLSTLRSYVEGVGGKLYLVVEFPDRAPVILAGLGENIDRNETPKRAKKEVRTAAKSKLNSRRAA